MSLSLLLALGLLATAQNAAPASPPPKAQVFVLAGQSNMEGKAQVALLERQWADEALRPGVAALRDGDGWVTRDDVSIRFLERQGPLTVGYGSPGCIGPELGFGLVVGDALDAPVLLVKTAWGGKSLSRDFRPPSAGLPPEAVLTEQLERERRDHPERTREELIESYGHFYREMLREVRGALADLDALVPGYAGQGYELAGLAWFQGWNDMIDDRATAEYADNLACFVRDVRRDLGAPALPIVVGQFGVGGLENREAKHWRFKAAQAAGVARAALDGGVLLVPTDRYWDVEAQRVFDSGWEEHREAWDRVGSNYPFHYLGSVRTMLGIGEALGRGVLELRAATALPQELPMQVHYLEIVTPDVDATCAALERLHGVSFGAPVVELGNARTARVDGGGRLGVRAPMHSAEEPVVRPYVLVDDVAAATAAAEAAGAMIALPSMEIPGQGTIAIYVLGGVQYGLWQE